MDGESLQILCLSKEEKKWGGQTSQRYSIGCHIEQVSYKVGYD